MSNFESAFSGYKLIYVFSMPYADHDGALKIGEATINIDCNPDVLTPNCQELNAAANKRIKQYTQTAGLRYDLLYTELAKTNVGKAFSDHDVHKVLNRSNIKKKQFEEVDGSKEWYMVGLDVVKNAIQAVKEDRKSLDPNEISSSCAPINLRDEQKEAVKKTIKRFKSGHNRMLWYAKMRFGKTLTAMSLVGELGLKRTIIITHRPVVKDGWYDDFKKLFCDKPDYKFASRTVGENFEDVERDAKHDRCKYLYFASIQDLRGAEAAGGKFDKNNAIFNTDWDMVIIDEAHEGTQTELGKTIAELLVKDRTYLLQLSGTPFNLLDNIDEDEVYTWDYIMEQRAKADWHKKHFGEPNPYASLPKMNIFTYDMSQIDGGKYGSYTEDKYFNFSEFFKTKPNGDFVHEDDIRGFLNLLVNDKADSNYPFSKQEYRDNFRHSLWMVPGVKEAKALSKLLKEHPVFGQFNIANVAGDGDEETNFKDALDLVRKAITDHPQDTYSITISCGRLTTGVTVPEWTAVFMLAGAYSTAASTYMQTIFRVQSAANINGRIKENCFVFDFAPDRTLKCVAESVKVSTRAGRTRATDRAIMADLLQFCPIISVTGSHMNPYNVNGMLEQLKRAYIDRIVTHGFEDPNLFNRDMLLQLDKSAVEKFDALQKLIGSSTSKNSDTNKEKQIIMADNGMNPDGAKQSEQQPPQTPLSDDERAALEERKEAKSKREKALKALKGVAIRIPMLIYGADIDVNQDIDLEQFVDMVDPISWDEFMPRGIDKEVFKQFIPYFDRDAFIGAGKEIRQRIKRADRMEPTTRTRFMTALFSTFKNPDKETVLTPWRVVNMHMGDCLGGYNFYDPEYKNPIPDTEDVRYMDIPDVTEEVFGPKDTKILEINSKSGLYPLYVTYTIWRKRCAENNVDITKLSEDDELFAKAIEIWDSVVQNNVYIICKTQMAKSITQRTLCGYRDVKINAHAFDNLVTMIKDGKNKKFIEKATSCDTYNVKCKEKDMKFNAVVGNPPYQVSDGGDAQNNVKARGGATPLYDKFVDVARVMEPQFLSMIIPSRWFSSGRGLDVFRESMLNDQRLRNIFDYTYSNDLFPGVEIKGGVCYFLWDKKHKSDCVITTIRGKNKSTLVRPLRETQTDTFIRYNEAISVLRKVQDTHPKSFENLVSTQKPFGMRTFFVGRDKKFIGSIKLFGNNKISYVEQQNITQNLDWVDRYKVYISAAYGAGESFPHQILNKPFIGDRGTCCTETYLVIGPFDSEKESEHVIKYIKTLFFRFMVLMVKNTQHASKKVYHFVPIQDFTSKSDIDWSKSIADIDKQLYKKYGLDKKEIDFIESMIKPME